MNTEEIKAYIKEMEALGLMDKNCKTCLNVFYPEVAKGKKIIEIFAPAHKASTRCKSGKYNHCTCDTCF